MEKLERVYVNDVGYYPFSSFDEMYDFIKDEKKILVAINAGKIARATDETREIINKGIGYCDGIGAVWGLRKKGCKNAVIISGCDIWTEFITRLIPEGKKFYFIGGTQDIIDRTISKLQVDFPNINIVGYRNGFIKTEQEKEVLKNDLLKQCPDFVFVAMGSPRQELLMNELYKIHPAMYQGLGGSFDVYVGAKSVPPSWVRKLNLYGVYRVLSDFNKARAERFFNDLLFCIKLMIGKY